MASIINTNVASLNAQRNLNTSQGLLGTALQRLSSGLRINSAKDDAAGLAISERFSTQINGLNQAVRNANDGISLAQTGEGALAEVTNNLQRIREIAVQAANATNSIADRNALNLEVQQRLAEIDRSAAQTSFNGQKLLDGSFGSANFQIGANAGEVIGINLQTNVRTASTGSIATATTTQAVGATSSGGTVTATTDGTLSFGTAASAATSGNITVNAGTRLYGTSAAAQVDGTNTFDATNALVDQSVAASAATAKVTTSAAFTAGDYTLSGAAAHFEFTDDTVTSLTVAVDGTNYTGNEAGLVTAIQGQLTAAGSNTVVSYAGGSLVFTSGETGSTATQPTIANVGADLAGDGLAGFVNSGGADAVATTNSTFTVDGQSITLNGNYSGGGGLATLVTDLQGALDTAFGANIYTAANTTGNNIKITHNNSTTAVAIDSNELTTAGANAVSYGFTTNGGTAGTAGTAAVPTTNASFSVAGYAVTLTTDYASFDALATDLESKLDTAAGSDTFTVTNNNGALSISRNSTGVGSTSVDITGADAVATAAGFGNAVGTAGQDAVATTNASFDVDGTTVTLNANYADNAALRTAIQSQLTGYTVSGSGNDITITNDTAGSAAVAITNADANAIAAGIVDETGTAGVAGGSITLASGDFAIQVGSATAIDLAGTYASGQELVDAINSKVSGVLASVDDAGKLTLSSPEALTLTGTRATATGNGNIGFSSGSVAANNGSLDSVSTDTVANALAAIQRVDSALSTISSLRSTFGAVQNRFESVISSQSTTVENLASARSRIQDADFAAETANLTRAQILQQAGVAILSQANSLPQSVLSLLR